MRVRVSAKTDPGRVRERNEDAFLVVDLDTQQHTEDTAELSVGQRGVLLAVSDGMGGAAAGDVASALSVKAVLDEIERDQGSGGIPDRLRRVVTRASRRVHEAARRDDRRGMGATLTAALVCGSNVHLAQVGDSRAYLIRGGRIRQVTHDQSYVQMLVDEGILTPEEAERSPQKNVILQAMGQKQDVRVDTGRIAVQAGDRLLLCSDGLTNVLSDERILELCGGATEQATAALIAEANRGGGPDNITVVLAELA